MALAQFRIEYDQGGLAVLNTGFLRFNTDTQQGFEDAANILAANWAANILPSMSQDITMGDVILEEVDGVKIANSILGLGQPGSIARPSTPVNVAAVITRSDLSSRRKGRWFLPGVPDDKVDAGAAVDPAWYSNLRAQFDVTAANLAAQDQTEFMNRHNTAGPNNPPNYVYALVVAFGITSKIGSQSGRRS